MFFLAGAGNSLGCQDGVDGVGPIKTVGAFPKDLAELVDCYPIDFLNFFLNFGDGSGELARSEESAKDGLVDVLAPPPGVHDLDGVVEKVQQFFPTGLVYVHGGDAVLHHFLRFGSTVKKGEIMVN